MGMGSKLFVGLLILAAIGSALPERPEDKEKAKKEAAEKMAEATKWATKWKISPESYILGDSKIYSAVSMCIRNVIKTAIYQAEKISSWNDDYNGWSMSDNFTIVLTGSNVKMQNAFGAWKNVQYSCKYDLRDGAITVLYVT
jgi:hypothetical protein